ncbi:AhpC/TSA family protein [Tenacibaculum dicentrarchi]|nr:AhpC/TSA family protein [Tenacibaculum dicentrarchi]
MIKSMAILCLIIFLSSCEKIRENDFLIEANITGIKDSTKVYLFNVNTYKVLDSTIIVNNKFSFKGKLNDPIQVQVFINDTNICFWLENKKVTINASKEQLLENGDNFSNYTTKSEIQKIALRHETIMKPFYENKRKAYKKFREKLISEEMFEKHVDSVFNTSTKFLFENPNNFFSLSKILDTRDSYKKDKLDAYFMQLPIKLKNSSYGKLLDNFLHIKPLKEGDFIIDIIGQNLNDDEVKLSDFKGKIILLDFWASWCPPCVKKIKEEFPPLIEKYKDKNFQIISYSFDIQRNMWKNGSDKLQISWPDFSNLTKMNNSPVALQYAISSIPICFIINEEGKILKRVEYDDNLEKELDNVFFIK